MLKPRLLEGNDFHVMVRNLWRLIACGMTLAEARPLVLAQAGVSTFPRPPRRLLRPLPKFETLDTSATTIH